MFRIVLIMALLCLPLVLQAEDHACLISFDSARLNVCTGQVEGLADGLEVLADIDLFQSSAIRVVKFSGPVGASQRQAIEKAGAEILGYAPYHAYVTRMSPEENWAVNAIEGVVWTGPFLPIWKLDVNLVSELSDTEIARHAGLESVIVSLFPEVPAVQVREDLDGVDGLDFSHAQSVRNEERLIFRFSYGKLEQSVMALAMDDRVASISFQWPVELKNSQAGWLHQSGELNVIPVFERGLFGCGQVLGVLDTGLHVSHCSFEDSDFGQPEFDTCSSGASCPVIEPDFDHRKVPAHYKWSGQPGNPSDVHGHGTHVIGSAVGNDWSDPVDCETLSTPGSLTNLDGTAPGAQVISQEAGGTLEYLNILGGSIYHAAEVAYHNQARIHNNSWGNSCRNASGQCVPGCQITYSQNTRDADSLVWDYPEMALFVAAGNSGSGCGPGADVGAPGNAKNVFSIGSNLRGQDGDGMSGFSSRGPANDGRTRPDMTAQGGGVTAPTAIQSAQTASSCGVAPNSGTSMASPTAAGLAALIRDYLARGFYPFGQADPQFSMTDPSAALIRAMMINGAQGIDGLGSGDGPPNQHQGWGRVNLDQVLYFEGDERQIWLHDEKVGLETGAVDVHFITVDHGNPLKVTVVWHDYPALLGTNPHIVNSLRLEVVTPSGAVWTQKLPAGGGLNNVDPYQHTTATNYDNRNTVHQIRLPEPDPGVYEIRIRGIQVAQGGLQPYALVATGGLEGISDPSYFMTASPDAVAICAGEQADYEIQLFSALGFDDEVTLSLGAGLPPGADVGFNLNPVIPGSPPVVTTLSVTTEEGAEAGDYLLEVGGQSSGQAFPQTHRFVELALIQDATQPATPALSVPAEGDANVPSAPEFQWQEVFRGREYRIQLSTDPGFADPLVDAVIPESSFIPPFELDPLSKYYWRVSALNICGEGEFGEPRSFVTQPAAGDCPLDSQASMVMGETFGSAVLPQGWSTEGSVGDVTWVTTDARAFVEGHSLYAENIDSESDQHLLTPAIELPADMNGLLLNFRTWQHIQSWPQGGCYDGGLLEISTDNGDSWQQIDSSIVLARDYDGPISVSWGNPLAGRDAWCGDPRDTWERYAINLSQWSGETVRFRFRFGTDTQHGSEGWYIDDLHVRACVPLTTYTVGGTVSNLQGAGLVLQNNGGDDLEITGTGDVQFAFETPLADGESYEVTVAHPPFGQMCLIESGSGTVSASNVEDVIVVCNTLPDPVFGDRFQHE